MSGSETSKLGFFLLALTLKSEAFHEIFIDPLSTGEQFLGKVEELPGGLPSLVKRGAWAPNAVLDPTRNEWSHLCFSSENAVEILAAELRNLPEVEGIRVIEASGDLLMKYGTSLDMQRQIGAWGQASPEISNIYGVVPASLTLPEGYRLWVPGCSEL